MTRPHAVMANDDDRKKEQSTPAPTAPSTADEKDRKDRDETKDNRKGGYGAG